MTADTIFQICNILALIGWILLVLLPNWWAIDKFIIGVVITMFAIVYSGLVFGAFNAHQFQNFNSLDGVMQLFRNRSILTAGWIHYLAFDLLAGVFIRKNAIQHGISHWLVLIPLIITFLLGPLGLLLYLLIRFIVTREYFAENF